MKRNRLLYLGGAALALALAFGLVACGGDDDGGDPPGPMVAADEAQIYIDGSGANHDGSEPYTGGATVKLALAIASDSDEDDPDFEYIPVGTIDNGKLNITLPATIDGKYLSAMSDIPEGLTSSDINAKVCDASSFDAFDDGDKYIGSISYEKETTGSNETIVQDRLGFFYADRAVAITGFADEHNMTYNMNCVKGWNKVYQHMVITISEDSFNYSGTLGAPAFTGGKWLIDLDN